MSNENLYNLKVIPIGKLKGRFHIPDYQRGYRWQRRQVQQLLDDIKQSPENRGYYLQPITVIKRPKKYWEDSLTPEYDLIDGQQRLTTLFLLFKALQQKAEDWKDLNELNPECITESYKIKYDTRTSSEAFLENIAHKSGAEASLYPDYLYMWHAYKKIMSWINGQTKKVSVCEALAEKLFNDVRVIWYEISTESENAWNTFANLNSGKIPLTNSELVKALFLSSENNSSEDDKGLDYYEKSSLVEQWDSIERDLSIPSFWAFLTNTPMEEYPTKIDLLLDMIASKPENERNEYFTFAYFEKKYNHKKKLNHSEWQSIYDQYLKLRDWYDDNELFHKIGYLIAVKAKSLHEIYQEGKNKSDDDFKVIVDGWIKDSISVNGDKTLQSLEYNTDYDLITRLMILLNIQSTLALNDNSLRYPLHLHKESMRNKGGWSLEHIHAQKSEQIKKEGKRSWMTLHLASLDRYSNLCHQEYLKRAEQADNNEDNHEREKLDEQYRTIVQNIDSLRSKISKCNELSDKDLGDIKPLMDAYAKCVVLPFSGNSDNIYRDELRNMALLTKDDNAVLNNSSFDVKRIILLQDMTDHFIPPFTQKVFSKTLPGCDIEQMFFWGDKDRIAYLEEIKRVLSPYLENQELPKK